MAEGVYLSAHGIIGPGAEIGEHVFMGANVHVGHDTIVEPYARLRIGCNIAGHVRIGAGATMGMSATIIEELQIGAGAMIAAGAVVVDDVAPGTLVAGVPAQFKRFL